MPNCLSPYALVALAAAALAAAASRPLTAQGSPASAAYRAAHQRLAYNVYKELIEMNTADSVGSTTPAAEAVAKRFLAAGFPASDVQVLTPRADKGNVVVRYRGRGTRKPLLLLAHLDVVQALRSDWSPELDPFKLTERDG